MTAGTEQISEALALAADLIEARGWVQGAAEDHGRICMVRALEIACRGMMGALYGRAVTTVYREVFGSQWGEYDSLPAWNDMPDRTVEEVTTAFRNAKRWA